MILNYITGPSGCGKTRHLESLEVMAKRLNYPVLRFEGNLTLTVLQAELHRVKPNTVVLVDEGAILGSGGLDYGSLMTPPGVQMFVARLGTLNGWNAII